MTSTVLTNSRDTALRLVGRIADVDTRRLAENSLRSGADMNTMVTAFHRVYNQPIVPTSKAKKNFGHMTKERLAMRFGLIVEEFVELCEAMDIRADINFYYLNEEDEYIRARSATEEEYATFLTIHGDDAEGGRSECDLNHSKIDAAEGDMLSQIVRERVYEAVTNTHERNVVEVADALFDMKYVIIGFELETGIPSGTVASEGQASNLSKLGEDGQPIRREDGKILKGPYYFKPDMARALRSWGMPGV